MHHAAAPGCRWGWHPQQAITLVQALDACTRGVLSVARERERHGPRVAADYTIEYSGGAAVAVQMKIDKISQPWPW
jgi:hypothetical protein